MSDRSETQPPVCWETLSTTPCEQSPILSSSWVGTRKVDLVFSRQTGFFECACLLNKPMVITEPAVPSARLLGLGSKLYPSNMKRMVNKDFTRFKQSFSRTANSSKRKKDCAGRVFPQQREEWSVLWSQAPTRDWAQWRIQERGPGGPALPLFLVQSEAQRAKKCLFWRPPPPPSPPYLRSGSGTEADKNGDLFPIPPKSPSCFTACAFWCGMLERHIRAYTWLINYFLVSMFTVSV